MNVAAPARQTYLQARQTFDWSIALDQLGWSGQSAVALAETLADRHARGVGADRTAIRWIGASGSERCITFGELSRQSARFGNLLRRIGIREGDRVATVLPRIPAALPVIIGAWRAGAILVPVFTGFAPEAVAYRLRHSGAKAVCVGSRFRHLVPAIDPLTIITVDSLALPAHPGDIDGDRAVASESEICDPARYDRNDPAAIIYTSGSTGQPKGCVIAANILAAMWPYVTSGLDLRAQTDVFWPTGDPSWGYGLCCYLPALAIGASVLCVEANAGPDLCRDIIGRFKVSNLATTPTVLRSLMAQGDAIREFGSSVRVISSCGEPLNGEVVAFFRRVWDVTPMDHFGATEFGLPIGNHNAIDMAVKPGSMGLPAPGQDMAVVDERGEPLAADRVGLIGQRSDDNNCYWLRYWDDEAATSRLRRGQWICTGDLARRDQDGYFWFEGRTDDIIKSSGYRIGPFEIESAILKHRAVAEAAVVGIADPLRGQAIKAFVVLRPGVARPPTIKDDIVELVKATCGRHQAPQEIAIVESLPKTQTGKIQRFLLRQSANQNKAGS
jgi:acetyl-CoA synthetase